MQTLKVIGPVHIILVRRVRDLRIYLDHARRSACRETGTGHAIGLSAVVGGIMEGLFSPLTWLVLLVSSGAAFVGAKNYEVPTCRRRGYDGKFADVWINDVLK